MRAFGFGAVRFFFKKRGPITVPPEQIALDALLHEDADPILTEQNQYVKQGA